MELYLAAKLQRARGGNGFAVSSFYRNFDRVSRTYISPARLKQSAFYERARPGLRRALCTF